jgi:hypothetical protein
LNDKDLAAEENINRYVCKKYSNQKKEKSFKNRKKIKKYP